MANLLTLARVALVFVVVAVWGRETTMPVPWLDLVMVPLLAWAIFMDALDGWVARRWKEESPPGALFDIAGDRIVELTLWVFFATTRDASGQALVPLWVPLAMIARTVLTDFVRAVGFRQGRTPFGRFGPPSAQGSGWGRQVTASRWSRGAYGAAKAVCFCALGLALAWQRATVDGGAALLPRGLLGALVLVTVGFSIVRALPVLLDGYGYLLATRYPEGSRGPSPFPADEPSPRSTRASRG